MDWTDGLTLISDCRRPAQLARVSMQSLSIGLKFHNWGKVGMTGWIEGG